MSEEQDALLLGAAEAIADGRRVDWGQLERTRPDLGDTLGFLKELERLAGVHRAALPPGLDPHAARTAAMELARLLVPAPTGLEEPPPPTRWGPLEIEVPLAGNGFAEAFRARVVPDGREVVLKLWREVPGDPEAVLDRLIEDARGLARVRHPGLVVVHGADRHEGRAGMWTDPVDGPTVEEWLRSEGPRGHREAAEVGIELCRALAVMHSAGLVHRDVKAANVIRTGQGRFVLLEFGSLGGLGVGHGLAARTTWRGSPLTMAPEQFGGGTTPATDFHGVGALLFRLVTGRHPIETRNLDELVGRLLVGDRPALGDLGPELPAAFVEAVERALDPDPARRFPDAREMEAALEEARACA